MDVLMRFTYAEQRTDERYRRTFGATFNRCVVPFKSVVYLAVTPFAAALHARCLELPREGAARHLCATETKPVQ